MQKSNTDVITYLSLYTRIAKLRMILNHNHNTQQCLYSPCCMRSTFNSINIESAATFMVLLLEKKLSAFQNLILFTVDLMHG